MDIDRRELLKGLGALGIAAAGAGIIGTGFSEIAEAAPSKTKLNSAPIVAVARAGSTGSMVKKAIDKLGGISRFVKKGAKVVIKPNIAWARTPYEAANTNPMVVYMLIKLCREAGAGSVKIYEFSCDNSRTTFEKSGIKAVCDKLGVELISADNPSMYREIKVHRGKTIKSMNVISAILDADCYINVPVAKVHGSGIVSLSLKNQMGCVYERGSWHRRGLHQCIADAATALAPDLSVLDASRTLTTNGPAGPGKVVNTNVIAASTDMVALDAFGTTLLNMSPDQVNHIKMAQELGVGIMDLKKIKISEA